jgi:hypothetical protein
MKKVDESTQIDRLKWLSMEGFNLKSNYEWHNLDAKIIVHQHCIEYYSDEQWERLIDGITYHISN